MNMKLRIALVVVAAIVALYAVDHVSTGPSLAYMAGHDWGYSASSGFSDTPEMQADFERGIHDAERNERKEAWSNGAVGLIAGGIALAAITGAFFMSRRRTGAAGSARQAV